MVKLDMLRSLISADIQRQLSERDAKIEEWAKMVLHTYAKPQIRGEITKGKLKWRGIKFVATHNNFGEHTSIYTITQRGIQLGSFEVTLM